MDSLGVKIKKLMVDHGINQTILAQKMGVTQTTVSNLINGKTSLSHQNMTRLRDAFNLPINFFDTIDSSKRKDVISEPAVEYRIESNPFADVLQWMNKIEMRMAALEKDHVIT